MELVSKDKCFGCTACMAVCNTGAIQMEIDPHGFQYPVIDLQKCVNCGKCRNACPALDPHGVCGAKETIDVYAIKSRDTAVLENSSSGGLFTVLSDYVLSQNGVIYASAHNEMLETIFTRADSVQERDKQRGSKYVQSNMGDIFGKLEKDIKKGMKVLFVGTPCQIAAVNHIVPQKNKNQIITVDIICNGVPSPLVFQKYIQYCEKKEKNSIIEHFHRPKDLGWGHNEKNIFSNGKVDRDSEYSQAWKMLFYSSKAHRECCYSCPYTNLDRVSDITIGDYWGIEKTDLKIPREGGVSLCIANTIKGKAVIKELTNRQCLIEKSRIEDAIVKQPRLRGVCASSEGSELFWREFERKGSDFVIEKYGRCSDWIILKHQIKRVLVSIGVLRDGE